MLSAKPDSGEREILPLVAEENVEIVRRIREAVQRRDSEALLAFYDPEIVLEIRYGPIDLHGLYHGHDGVRRWFREWRAPFSDYDEEAEDYIDAADSVIVCFRVRGCGKASGVSVDTSGCQVYVIQNGRVIRMQIFETKAEALAAAGLQE